MSITPGSHRPRLRGLPVGWLLSGVSGLILLSPVGALLVMQIYQTHLVRQTETGLITQSVVVAELYRDRWLEEMGAQGATIDDILPPSAKDVMFAPVEPTMDLGGGLLPPLEDPRRWAGDTSGPSWRAGRAISPLLVRTRVYNLTSVRVLGPDGCVVAASGTWMGACVDDLPEIAQALAGRYTSVARERVSDSPAPPMESISRRGDIRVFTALPIFHRKDVIGVVWMSRTSMAPLKAAYLYRRPLLLGLVGVLLLTAFLSLVFARSITRPLRQITLAAESIARGGAPDRLAWDGFAPAEVHMLGDALFTMTRQLSDRAEYISEFAANVSHELKSPITAIRGAAELLREGVKDMAPSQRERFLANIEADASRMERLVNRLMELARIQSAPAAAQEVDIEDALGRVADGHDGRVTVIIDDCPRTISINPDHLESAVRNLLDNALRHSGDSPVVISARREGGMVAIEVTDRGSGIDAKNLERIFDRFFTTERDRGGTGLGLAIVKAVALTRGGDVTVRTGPEGTTFTLTV